MANIQFENFRFASISHSQIMGRRHLKNGQPCEDVLFIKSTERLLICGIADGKSDARYGVLGGQACLETAAHYLEHMGIINIIDHPFPDELPYVITMALRNRLLALASSKQAEFKDFASTLLIIVADMINNRYAVVHLGDGCVIATTQDGNVTLLSAPDNGLTEQYTWLTTSENAISHLRIITGSLDSKKRLLLLSNGAACFCRGRNIPFHVRECIHTGTCEDLQRKLANSCPEDDASCIIIDLCNYENP